MAPRELQTTKFELPPGVRLAMNADVPELRRLVNAAYEELADRGLNYTGTYQDEEVTRLRMQEAEVLLVHHQTELVAAINLTVKTIDESQNPCLYINQLAVHPDYKRRGLGTFLLSLAEDRARSLDLDRLRLDTAIPAAHLVAMYRRRGYVVIAEAQWSGKTYRSYIMEKRLADIASPEASPAPPRQGKTNPMQTNGLTMIL